MKYEADHKDWQMDAPYLASLPKINPFVVPEGYFREIPQYINAMVRIDAIHAADPHSGFIVPEHYFQLLHSNLSSRIFSSDPAFSIKFSGDKNVFATPDGYFDQLRSRIENRIQQEEQIQTSPLKVVEEQDLSEGVKVPVKKLWQSDFLKYVSAACIILVTAFGLFINQQQNLTVSSASDVANEQMLYDMDEQDIINNIVGDYPDQHVLNAARTDLESYLINNYSQSDLSVDL